MFVFFSSLIKSYCLHFEIPSLHSHCDIDGALWALNHPSGDDQGDNDFQRSHTSLLLAQGFEPASFQAHFSLTTKISVKEKV